MEAQASARPVRARNISLGRLPAGVPSIEDFEVHESTIGPLDRDELLIRNLYFSVDASMRLRMTPSNSPYLPPYGVGSELDGWAVGKVAESTSNRFAPGDLVVHYAGWRDIARVAAEGDPWTAPRKVTEAHAPQVYLGPLGPSGLTSWAGLVLAAELRADDVVYVSAGAGAVGSLAVQIARSRGHHVIASAGSPEKVRYLTDVLGARSAFDYHDGVTEGLARCAPDGIDVYFDNVGGSHLDAALTAMRPRGRIALCGAIADYNTAEVSRTGIKNLFTATERGLTLRGFLARMYAHHWAEFEAEVGALLREGAIVYPESIHEGLASAPGALVSLFTGANIGKTIVRI